MTPHDLAIVLLSKAIQDETALAKFADDPEIADEVVGFHAQQAVEKLLKALLVNADIDPERTHNLARLLRLLESSAIKLPEEFTDLDALTPFAVELRYGFFPDEADLSLDRPKVVELVRGLREWVERRIRP